MKTLKAQFAQHMALPCYLAAPNTLSVERAEEIAASYGASLLDCRADFEQANQYGLDVMKRADSRGNGLGQYHNAESLFTGYLYESFRCAACDSEEAARNDFQD